MNVNRTIIFYFVPRGNDPNFVINLDRLKLRLSFFNPIFFCNRLNLNLVNMNVKLIVNGMNNLCESMIILE